MAETSPALAECLKPPPLSDFLLPDRIRPAVSPAPIGTPCGMHATDAFCASVDNVRFAPKATVSRQSAICRYVQFRTHAPQQTTSLFDHLVGAAENSKRKCESKCLCGFHIDHKLNF